jgi:predicted alpha/beta superfamily hydrolase
VKTANLPGLVRTLGLTAALGVLGPPALAQAVAPAKAARPPISQVRIERIASARLGETREAWVSLPDRYDETQDRYPVLYMLDGEINFNSGVIGGLRQAGFLGEMPDLIVVGVVNTDRSKDIFPEVVTYGDGTKDGGRADAFLGFIGEELVPRIERTYRTEPFRVLYGTSNTGFTAVYALFKEPRLANVSIAASATLSVPILRDNRDAWIRDFKGGDKRLILIMGENDLPTVLSQNGALKEQCDLIAPAGLSCRLAVLRGGGHVPGNALVEGLRLAFEGWKKAAPFEEKARLEAIGEKREGQGA